MTATAPTAFAPAIPDGLHLDAFYIAREETLGTENIKWRRGMLTPIPTDTCDATLAPTDWTPPYLDV